VYKRQPPFHFVVSPSSPSDLLLLSKLSKLSPSAPLVHLNPPSPLPPPISLPVSLSSASGVPAASAFVLAALRLTNLGRSMPLLATRVAPDPLYSVWALPEKAGAYERMGEVEGGEWGGEVRRRVRELAEEAVREGRLKLY
jgi:hypothetical protein